MTGSEVIARNLPRMDLQEPDHLSKAHLRAIFGSICPGKHRPPSTVQSAFRARKTAPLLLSAQGFSCAAVDDRDQKEVARILEIGPAIAVALEITFPRGSAPSQARRAAPTCGPKPSKIPGQQTGIRR